MQDLYCLQTLEKIVEKWEQSEQDRLNYCNSNIILNSEAEEKDGTDSEQNANIGAFGDLKETQSFEEQNVYQFDSSSQETESFSNYPFDGYSSIFITEDERSSIRDALTKKHISEDETHSHNGQGSDKDEIQNTSQIQFEVPSQQNLSKFQHQNLDSESDIKSGNDDDSQVQNHSTGNNQWATAENPETIAEPEILSEDEALFQYCSDWVNRCSPGDELEIPDELLAEIDKLRKDADQKVRERNENFRVWRSGETRLACKMFFGSELPSPQKPKGHGSRFRRFKTRRIETMWSEDYGWCQWDPIQQDYKPTAG